MGVDGYLEIYTTLFGWKLYDMFWDMFSETGLIFVPLLGVLISNWKEPSESQDDKPAASTSLRRNTIQLPIMLVVYIIAIVPLVPIDLSWVTYTNECRNIEVNGERTNTTYDETLKHWVKDGDTIKAPIWWVLVTKIGAGISTSLRGEIGCINNLRDVDSMLRTLSIQDPQLREEYERFYSECYISAKVKIRNNKAWAREQMDAYRSRYLYDAEKYLQDNRIETARRGIRERDRLYAQKAMNQDLNYLAPNFYLHTPGLYAPCPDFRKCYGSLRASEPVEGWVYDANRDADYNPYELSLVAAGKRSGRPYCREWWLGPNDDEEAVGQVRRGPGLANRETVPLSLQTKLFNHASAIVMNNLSREEYDMRQDTSWFLQDEHPDAHAAARIDTRRCVIKSLMVNGPPKFSGGDWGVDSTSDKIIVAGLALFGGKEVLMEGGKFYVGLMFLKEVAPMVKAILLMCIYGLLLIYILTSGASLGSLLPASIMIMAIQSWGGLWTFAEFIDANLFAAMYPNPSAICGAGRSGMEFGTKRLVLDMLTTSLFVILPLVLTWMLTMAGMKSANLLNDLTNSSASGSKSLGGTIGSSGAKGAANKTSKAYNSIRNKRS